MHFVRWLLLCSFAFQATSPAASSMARRQQEAARAVTGTAVDRSGAPIPRVFIEVRNHTGGMVASALTDMQGGFSLKIPDGSYLLDATAPGLAPLRSHPLVVNEAIAPLAITLDIPSIQEKIVVTATRTDAILAQVGSSTTVLRGEELKPEGVSSVADALRMVPGLSVAQNGGPGQLVSVFIRGGESDYAKVLIDGIPVNEPGGSFNFANLSTAAIDRIEIVRGPQSALFGSDAMAGVIQIFTRRGESEGLRPRPFLSVQGGSFSTFEYEAGIGGRGEQLDYSATFSRFDTDNNVPNGSCNNTTVSANLGLRTTPGSTLRAAFRAETGRAGVPGQWAFHRPDPDEYYRHRRIAGGVTFTHSTTPSWTQTLFYTAGDSWQFSENADSGSYIAHFQGSTSPVLQDYAYQTLNLSLRHRIGYQADLALPHTHLLSAGAHYERESGSVGDPLSDPAVAVRNNYGGFVQDQWSLGKRLFAAAGVNLEDNASFGFSAAPRLSIALHVRQPGHGWLGLARIKANFGLGIKEPTLVESFSQSPYFQGNPDLKPEKSVSFDAGFEQHFGEGLGAAEVTYFENHFRDQIGFITTDFTTFAGTFFNIGKTRARGVEIGLRQKLVFHLEVAGSYSFTDSVVVENDGAFDPVFSAGQPLFRRPKHSGFLKLQWKPGRWTFGATGTYVGSRTDSDFLGLGLTRNPAYQVLDLLLSFRLFSGANVFLVVNNARNCDYMESLGYPALPARFRVGIATGW